MPNYAWPVAFAFAALCAACAFVNTYGPPTPDSAEVVCIKARGNWTSGWGIRGNCQFPNK